jgi:DNA primase small subunit
MPLTEKDAKFLSYHYNAYYQGAFKSNLYLTDFESREFALERWVFAGAGPGFVRHLGFSSPERLIRILSEDIPRHLYASAAHYQFPSEPSMQEKLWKDEERVNCDLIFDIDIDHIFTECKLEHDKWVCTACGATGRGPAPRICPNIRCSSVAFKEFKWECPICLEIAKEQISYLVENYLGTDFGINIRNPKELFITFSGRRGYHVHVEEKTARRLESSARREIVDYITGTGLDLYAFGINSRAIQKPRKTDPGWRGRITCLTIQYLQTATDNDLRKIIRRAPDLDTLRKIMIRDLNSENPTWRYEGVGTRTVHQIIYAAVKRYTPKIDEPVTVDIHRLIRLPGSLHGKTGFLVKKLSFDELQAFDPFSQAQVFEGEVRVFVYEAPKFWLQGVEYGPYKDQSILLPLNVAIYLLSREVATISK